MTKDEFDRAIEAIRQGHITPREGRVLEAAVMREIRNIIKDEEWGTDAHAKSWIRQQL